MAVMEVVRTVTVLSVVFYEMSSLIFRAPGIPSRTSVMVCSTCVGRSCWLMRFRTGGVCISAAQDVPAVWMDLQLVMPSPCFRVQMGGECSPVHVVYQIIDGWGDVSLSLDRTIGFLHVYANPNLGGRLWLGSCNGWGKGIPMVWARKCLAVPDSQAQL